MSHGANFCFYSKFNSVPSFTFASYVTEKNDIPIYDNTTVAIFNRHVKNIPNPFCPLIDTFKILLWYIFPFKMHPFFQTFIHDLFKSRQTSKTLGSKETRFSLHLRASLRAVSVTIFTISIFEVLYRLPFAK